MLQSPAYFAQPFPYICLTETFSDELCDSFESLFSATGEWQHRDGSFYQCSILDVTTQVSTAVQKEILARMREVTKLPLVDRILITAQHMQPGQAIGIHSDRPLLGYELVRLVVQFNKNWLIEHGGVLELFESQDGEACASVAPNYNKGFVFVLNESSLHGVTRAVQPRRSLVFNFWHIANTPELELHIRRLFTGIHFSELPPVLDLIASAAEEELAEEITLVAATAAVAIIRWGYDERMVVRGYKYSTRLTEPFDDESYVVVRLAHWVASLYRQTFSLESWQDLHKDLSGKDSPKGLEETWQLCVPVIDG